MTEEYWCNMWRYPDGTVRPGAQCRTREVAEGAARESKKHMLKGSRLAYRLHVMPRRNAP